MKKIASMMLSLAFAASCAAPALAAPAPLVCETDVAPEYATEAAAGMSEAEIQAYAYMDIDAAVNELEAKILSARNSYIWSKDWYDERYCGGASYGSIYDPEGTDVALPAFHDLFPADWQNPSKAEWDTIASVDESVLPKTQADKEYYAYLNQEEAVQELKDRIITARNELIFREDWAADGHTVYYVDPATGANEKLPTFSSLFPDWDLPQEVVPSTAAPRSAAPFPNLYFRNVIIHPAGAAVVPPFTDQRFRTVGLRWMRLYGIDYHNTDFIHLGFSDGHGNSLCHKRNAPAGSYLLSLPPLL